jgi:hypothetical protein
MSTTLRVLALFLTVAGAHAMAQVGIPILKLPATISKPGHYVLKRDLVLRTAPTGGNPAVAITIAADDVTLDLGGHIISHTLPAGTDVTGISGALHGGIRVQNGTVRGFKNGVYLNALQGTATDVSVEDLRVSGSGSLGIELLGEVISVKRCVISATGDSNAPDTIGLYLDGGFATVMDNDILATISAPANHAEGIHAGVQAGVFENNRVLNDANSHGYNGMFLGLATDYLVENNRVTGFATGIRFSSTGNPKYRNNLTTDCTTPYVSGTPVGTTNN